MLPPEEAPLLPDWFKIALTLCGGLGAWSLTIYFAKGWFEAKVLEPINKLGVDVEKIREGGEKVKEDAVDFITNTTRLVNTSVATQLEILKRIQTDTKKIVHEETTKMGAAFDIAVKQAAEASEKSKTNDQGLKDLRGIAEKNTVNIQRLSEVCGAVNERGKALEKKFDSEVVRINQELVIVKGKK